MVLWLAQAIKEIDPDIIFGYNSDSIAFRRIQEAAIRTGTRLDVGRGGEGLLFVYKGKTASASIAGRLHIDLYNFIENIFSTKMPSNDLSLESVSKDILWGKKPQTKAEAVLDIGEKLLPWIFEVSRISGEIPFDSSRTGPMQLLEWLFTRKSFVVGELVPNRPLQEEIAIRRQKSMQDGYICLPEPGIQEGVALFDLSGIYTNSIIENNVSPETFNCSCCAGDGNRISGEEYYFCSKKKGFVPQVLESLRKEALGNAVEQKKDSLKTIADACYDYFAMPESRWYSLTCLKSARTLGFERLKAFIDSVSGKYNVVYADSRSVFLKIVNMEDIEKVLMAAGKSHMEFGGLYKSALFLGVQQPDQRTRYALLDVIGRVTEYGVESYRRDWCSLAKQVRSKVIETLLVKRDTLKAAEVAKEYVKHLKAGKAEMKELVIATRIVKPIEQYEHTAPHIAAAKKSIAAGQTIRQWDTIKYIISAGVGNIFERAEPFWMAKSFDADYYIYNQIIPAALAILSVFGFSAEDLDVSEEGQTKLSSFVKE